MPTASGQEREREKESAGAYTGASPLSSSHTSMAAAKEKTGADSNIITREQLVKEEEALAKSLEFAKLLRSWERGRAMALELAAQKDRCLERARKRQQAEMKEELYHANKQLKMVRQAALRHRLTFEHMQYQLELNHLGKSFFAERL